MTSIKEVKPVGLNYKSFKNEQNWNISDFSGFQENEYFIRYDVRGNSTYKSKNNKAKTTSNNQKRAS